MLDDVMFMGLPENFKLESCPILFPSGTPKLLVSELLASCIVSEKPVIVACIDLVAAGPPARVFVPDGLFIYSTLKSRNKTITETFIAGTGPER